MESPEEATDFIRKRFGIEVSRQDFSATKSRIKKREGGGAPKGKRAPKAKPTPAAVPRPTAAAKPAAKGDPDMIDALASVKSLVKKLGAEQVRKIVSLFEV